MSSLSLETKFYFKYVESNCGKHKNNIYLHLIRPDDKTSSNCGNNFSYISQNQLL